MARHVVIVGGGAVGTHLASLLLAGGHPVRVIEVQREDIPRLQCELSTDVVIEGDGTDPAVLEAAGIRQAHVVAAVTGIDETNLVVTRLARFAFHVPRTIARVHTPKHAGTPRVSPYGIDSNAHREYGFLPRPDRLRRCPGHLHPLRQLPRRPHAQ